MILKIDSEGLPIEYFTAKEMYCELRKVVRVSPQTVKNYIIEVIEKDSKAIDCMLDYNPAYAGNNRMFLARNEKRTFDYFVQRVTERQAIVEERKRAKEARRRKPKPKE